MRVRIATYAKAGPLFAGLAVAIAACASPGASAPAGSGGQQVVQTAAAGATCTFDKYNGRRRRSWTSRVTVGFAQSEKEANPFRIAETQSIKDEAAKRGHQADHHQRPVGPQQGDRRHQGHDRPGRQGADHLAAQLRGPRPGPRLRQAKKVPIMTIDRFLTTKTACTDYIGWVGSDFVEQGKRASDAMITATGDRATWRSCSAPPASTSPTTDRRASRTRWPPRPRR